MFIHFSPICKSNPTDATLFVTLWVHLGMCDADLKDIERRVIVFSGR